MSNHVTVSSEHLGLIESFIATGRFDGPEAVIAAALGLLRDRERERTARLSALHAALDAEMREAQAALNVDETFREIEQLLSSGLTAREACAAA